MKVIIEAENNRHLKSVCQTDDCPNEVICGENFYRIDSETESDASNGDDGNNCSDCRDSEDNE